MTKNQLLEHALALIALAKSEGDWIDNRWHRREERIVRYLTEHFLEKEAFNSTYIATAGEVEWQRKRLVAFSKAWQDSIDRPPLATWEQLWKTLDKVRSILRARDDSDSIWAVALINETLSEIEEQYEEDMEEE